MALRLLRLRIVFQDPQGPLPWLRHQFRLSDRHRRGRWSLSLSGVLRGGWVGRAVENPKEQRTHWLGMFFFLGRERVTRYDMSFGEILAGENVG